MPEETTEAKAAETATSIPATPAPSSDPWQNKTREHVINDFRELEQKLEGIQAELGAKDDWIRRVSPFFKVDVENDKVDLDETMVKELAQARGWVPRTGEDAQGQATQNATPPPSQKEEEPFMDRLEKQGPEILRDIIRQELDRGFKERLDPIEKTVYGDRAQAWIDKLSAEFPDFDSWKNKTMEYMSQKGIRAQSINDLRDAYVAAKAIHGGFIDKAQHEQHVTELQKTLSILNPAATRPQLDPEKASTAQLLGLENVQAQTPEQKAISGLFGKKYLRE